MAILVSWAGGRSLQELVFLQIMVSSGSFTSVLSR